MPNKNKISSFCTASCFLLCPLTQLSATLTGLVIAVNISSIISQCTMLTTPTFNRLTKSSSKDCSSRMLSSFYEAATGLAIYFRFREILSLFFFVSTTFDTAVGGNPLRQKMLKVCIGINIVLVGTSDFVNSL